MMNMYNNYNPVLYTMDYSLTVGTSAVQAAHPSPHFA